ncbi:MAG: hypothetical protein ABEK04_04645, partial [Candidatus Nanohalobium sp.]
ITLDPQGIGPDFYLYGRNQKINLDDSQKVTIIKGKLIGTNTTIDGNDNTAKQQWTGLNCGQTYSWFVKAVEDDGQASTISDTWAFETTCNKEPGIAKGPEVHKSSSGHAFNVSALVNNPEGEDKISSCELEVKDGEGNVESYTVSNPSGGTNSTDAECSFTGINYADNPGWGHMEELKINLTVEDENGGTGSKTGQTVFPNNKPMIKALDIVRYTDRKAFRVEAILDPSDAGFNELRSCSIVVDVGESSFSIGSLEKVSAETGRCVADNIGPSRFDSLTVNERIDVKVSTVDIHGSTDTKSRLMNVPTGVSYPYSAVVMEAGGLESFTYYVNNQFNSEVRFRTKLEGVQATFSSNGNDSITYELGEDVSKSFRVVVTPNVSFTGTKELRIETTNLATGTTKVNTMPVRVRENTDPEGKIVPGIGLLHLLVLTLLATSVYYRRI